jgi:hypothetical protein
MAKLSAPFLVPAHGTVSPRRPASGSRRGAPRCRPHHRRCARSVSTCQVHTRRPPACGLSQQSQRRGSGDVGYGVGAVRGSQLAAAMGLAAALGRVWRSRDMTCGSCARVEARGDPVIAAGREGGRPAHKSPWPPSCLEEGDNAGRQAGTPTAWPVCAVLHPDSRRHCLKNYSFILRACTTYNL